MTDPTPTAPTVLSLTFDYDNVNAATVRGTKQIDLDLAAKLQPGQYLRIAFGDGYLNLSPSSTYFDGTKTANVYVAATNEFVPISYTVSGGGTHIAITTPDSLCGDLTEITATAKSSTTDPAPVITTTAVTTLAPEDAQINVGNHIDNFTVTDSYGHAQSLFNTNTTQLAVIDLGALWCAPTSSFLNALTMTQAQLGTGFDLKSILFEDSAYQYVTKAQATAVAAIIGSPGDVFAVSTDDATMASLYKELGLTYFSPQLVVDQVTGEVLGRIDGSSVNPAEQTNIVVQAIAGILADVEAAAAQPGVTRVGTDGSDVLAGSVHADVLRGLGGVNYLDGGYGDDRLFGGDQKDYLNGGAGHDILVGGAGDDRLAGGAGNDLIIGGDGFDYADVSSPQSSLVVRLHDNGAGIARASDGSVDHLRGVEGVSGGELNDTLYGSSAADGLYGYFGDDVIHSGGADPDGSGDLIYGEAGNDVIWLDGGRAFVNLGVGNDVVHIGDGFATIIDDDTDQDTLDFSGLSFGIHIAETIFGITYGSQTPDPSGFITFAGQVTQLDRVIGTDFADWLGADSDGTVLAGGRGDDQLDGGAGYDVLYGQAGRDTISGGGGDDYMAGGAWADTLTGGAGADTFVWDVDAFRGRDTVTDFSTADGDKLDLSNLGALAFVGDARFDGAGAGEVRFEVRGDDTLVLVDTDGDKHADLSIALTGVHALTANDFLLAPASDLPG